MMLRAGRDQWVHTSTGRALRRVGDAVPEASQWPTLPDLLRDGTIIDDAKPEPSDLLPRDRYRAAKAALADLESKGLEMAEDPQVTITTPDPAPELQAAPEPEPEPAPQPAPASVQTPDPAPEPPGSSPAETQVRPSAVQRILRRGGKGRR